MHGKGITDTISIMRQLGRGAKPGRSFTVFCRFERVGGEMGFEEYECE